MATTKKAHELVPGDIMVEPTLTLIDGRWATVDTLRWVEEVSIQAHAVDVTFKDGAISPFNPNYEMEVAL